MNAKDILTALSNVLKRIEFAEAKLENGTVLVSDDFAEGSSIFIKVEDDDTKVPLPIGEYDMEDGKKLLVIEEGIIGKIGEITEEVEETVEETTETELNTNTNNNNMKESNKDLNLEEEVKEPTADEQMAYVSREELEEIKKDVEEIKAAIQKMEEHEDEKKVEAEEKVEEEKAELKKELSKAAAAPIRHNPEARGKTNLKNISPGRVRNTIMDRVMDNISRIN